MNRTFEYALILVLAILAVSMVSYIVESIAQSMDNSANMIMDASHATR